jgi:hypothetical protein
VEWVAGFSGIRSQSLILEFDLGNAVSFTMNGGFATLHANGLRWFIGSVWCHHSTNSGTVFLWPETLSLHLFTVFSGLHVW